ncbi:MAG: hypothetical protein ACP5NZ_04805 [Nanobdellota archaeon]
MKIPNEINPTSKEYLPYKKVFLPMYKLLRKDMKINPYVSNMLTWTSNAIIHGSVWLPINGTIATGMYGFYLGLGALDTYDKYNKKKERIKKLRKIKELEKIL